MNESQRLVVKNTIAHLIHNCKNIRELTQIHSHVLKSPTLSPNDRSFLISRLIFHLCTTSASSASLNYATKIFNLIQRPTLFVYNAMIRANATTLKNLASTESLILYKILLENGLIPDSITFPFVLKECSKRADVIAGRAVHVHGLKFGYGSDVYVQNGLINLYSECGVLGDARKVFDEMPDRDVVSWNSIIIGCLRSGEVNVASGLFRAMPERKNIVTWNSVITGLVQGGRAKEALEIFHEMQVHGNERDTVYPDKVTMASVLSACASLGAINLGRWVHSYLERSGMECDMVIATALIDMYGKCGFIERAFQVFRGMPDKDVLAWSSMISAFALHGYGHEALELFDEMGEAGACPNAVTFVGLLSACAHCGLVEKGQWIFETMRNVHRVEPQVEHYACMIDVLGRAGRFDEAERVIKSMPMRPDAFVWGALLGACQMHGNITLGEKVARLLIELEPNNHAFYIVLCDLYAKSGRYDDCKRIRSLMKDRHVRKCVPGSSLLEVDGVVHQFSVKGSLKMPMEALQIVLMMLNNEMKMEKDKYAIM